MLVAHNAVNIGVPRAASVAYDPATTVEAQTTVNAESYHFQLGRFECLSLSDGSWDYPLKNLFANVPVEEIHEALRRHSLPIDYITTPYSHLYVNTGEHQVLVDMGAGDYLAPRTGKLSTVNQTPGHAKTEDPGDGVGGVQAHRIGHE